MLKIKDNVDLKDLQKFGFDDEEEISAYCYYGECEWGVYGVSVEKETRGIDLYICTGDKDYSVLVSECTGILFDLFQAGLVEKVSERMKQEQLKTELLRKDKEQLVELYLQKCYDTNVEMEQLKAEIQRLKMEASYEKEHKEKSYKYTEELRKQTEQLKAENEKLIKNYDELNSKYCAEMDKVTILQQQLKDNTNQVCDNIKIELFKKVAYMKNNNHEYIQKAVCWQDIVPIIDKIKKGGAE